MEQGQDSGLSLASHNYPPPPPPAAAVLRRSRTGRHPDTYLPCLAPHRLDRDVSTLSRTVANPNRFSDPLNQSTLSHRLLPSTFNNPPAGTGRPYKAYSWYLDNGLPWRHRTSHGNLPQRLRASHEDILQMPRVSHEDIQQRQMGSHEVQAAHSLFVDAGLYAETADRRSAALLTTMQDPHSRHAHRQLAGISHTWERVQRRQQQQQHTARTGYCVSHTLDCRSSGSLRTSPGRLSPQPFCQRAFGGGSSGQGYTSCGSSNPSFSPQASLNRLSPSSTLTRYVGSGARLSPTQLQPLSPLSLIGRQSHARQENQGPLHTVGSRSPYASPWASNSSSPVFQLSPFSASPASSLNGSCDVSYGSETDDEFFYVSCRQMTQGLADLAMSTSSQDVLTSPQPRHLHEGGEHVAVNPTFSGHSGGAPQAGGADEDEFDFDGCSDDALSDDVFLDDPVVATVGCRTHQRSMKRYDGTDGAFAGISGGEESDVNDGGVERLVVESLRRNSLQSKLRQTWRHRRNKDLRAEQRARSPHTAATATNQVHDYQTTQATSTDGSQPQPPTNDDDDPDSTTYVESKPSFYYVISPTDDVNMPDVIAVRKSSVELIRWQNSLRRRRRRQAKRHDLGRSRKREPRQSATV